MPSESHIIPVLVGDPQRCKAISDELLLRFCCLCPAHRLPNSAARYRAPAPEANPLHSDRQIERLVTALTEIWNGKAAHKKLVDGTRSLASDRGDLR
jgi:5-aminolevulinate synthase